ncbi:50S ribosomal protein L11 methyltransferase [Hypericibacter sp.]|uniref:50S ribosomal protein L11 methyltransferase n=1 Tax=Hypericibacter sp. TaxID=2705401 RepID=UPI003D6D77B4
MAKRAGPKPSSVGTPLWQFRIELSARDGATIAALEETLEPYAVALLRFERAKGKRWRIDALFAARPERKALAALLRSLGLEKRTWQLDRLPDRDWVAESQAKLPALKVGRFFVHGSHHRGALPRGKLALEIDAGIAFGTGRHQTTRGCLELIERLAATPPARPLDLGCGTGILALAMAKLWGVAVIAADNDPDAVTVTRENAERNGLRRLIRPLRSEGYAAAALKRAGPFDLIVANILARPLIEMAPDLARHLEPGGRAILSGLLIEQEDEVLAAHRARGLRCEARQHHGDWSALLLRKPNVRAATHRGRQVRGR